MRVAPLRTQLASPAGMEGSSISKKADSKIPAPEAAVSRAVSASISSRDLRDLEP